MSIDHPLFTPIVRLYFTFLLFKLTRHNIIYMFIDLGIINVSSNFLDPVFYHCFHYPYLRLFSINYIYYYLIIF